MKKGVFQSQRNSRPASTPASSATGRAVSHRLVNVSQRETLANCDSANRKFGESGETAEWKPSPPYTAYQSALVMPARSRVRLGPHHTPLSCSPPHT